MNPPIRPINIPRSCVLRSLFLKIMKTNKKVIIGERVVIITPPAPAVPYFIPKNEKIINEILSTELDSTNFKEFLFKTIGCFMKYKIGKKDKLIIKKR